jgi:hypothetical protein
VITASWASICFFGSFFSSADGIRDGWAMSALSFGAKRSISIRQLSTSEAGTMSKSVPSSLFRRLMLRTPSTWMVLPRPMSSARQPPSSRLRRVESHCIPSPLIGPKLGVEAGA